MAVDARRRYELYAAFEPHLGDLTAKFLELLHEVAEHADLRQRNHERFRREPANAYRLYLALRRAAGPEAAATVMELLDPIGWSETWPPHEGAAPSPVAASANGGDHGA